MSGKILDIISDYRSRMTSYRENLSNHLAHVISSPNKVMDMPKPGTQKEDWILIKQPRLGYDQIKSMLMEVQKTSAYLDRLHEIEKSILSRDLPKDGLDYMTIRNIEEFLGITKKK